jgi:hypothetical protein
MHPFGVGTSHGQPWTHLTHHGPDSGEATTFPQYSMHCSTAPTPKWLFVPGLPKWSPETVPNYPGLDFRDFGPSQFLAPISNRDELSTNLVALFESFPTPCCTPPTHVGIGSILDFLWSGVKLPIWLPALLLPITWAADVQMTHARPFWTSKLQDLSNDIKNTPMRGVLTPAIKL